MKKLLILLLIMPFLVFGCITTGQKKTEQPIYEEKAKLTISFSPRGSLAEDSDGKKYYVIDNEQLKEFLEELKNMYEKKQKESCGK